MASDLTLLLQVALDVRAARQYDRSAGLVAIRRS